MKLETIVNLLQYDLKLKQKKLQRHARNRLIDIVCTYVVLLKYSILHCILNLCYYTLTCQCINEKKRFFINYIILNSSSNNTLSNIKSQRIMNNWYAFHLHELAVSFNVSISDETNPKSFPFLIIHKGRIFMARHTRF